MFHFPNLCLPEFKGKSSLMNVQPKNKKRRLKTIERNTARETETLEKYLFSLPSLLLIFASQKPAHSVLFCGVEMKTAGI